MYLYIRCMNTVSEKKAYTFQSIIFSSILKIQQNQIYHWIRNYVVYLHVYNHNNNAIAQCAMLRIFTLHWLCVDNLDCFTSIPLHKITRDAHSVTKIHLVVVLGLHELNMAPRNEEPNCTQTVENIVDIKQYLQD